jgi:hypothetical protein
MALLGAAVHMRLHGGASVSDKDAIGLSDLFYRYNTASKLDLAWLLAFLSSLLAKEHSLLVELCEGNISSCL